MECWKTVRKNSGNSNARHFAKEDVDENCSAFTQVMDMGIGRHFPKKENLFWLCDRSGPIAEADDFPSGLTLGFAKAVYPVFPIKFECLKTRLKTLPKGNTEQHKAVRWEDIDDGVVKTKRKIVSCTKGREKGGRVSITKKDDGFTYRLCYLDIAEVICSDEEKE